MPFHSPRQIPSHPKSLAKSHLNLHQISPKKRTIHPLEFLVAGKDVPLKNPHILLMEEILHHMLFMKPYENWDKLPYQLVSLSHSFQQQCHPCLGASRSVLAFGAFCSTPFGHRAIGDPKPDRRRWGKKSTMEFPRVSFLG